MFETILIVVIILVVLIAIFRMINASDKGDNANSGSENSIQIPIPHPEHTNDYRFYKSIEANPTEIVERLIPSMKRGELYLKPEYEKAINQKIETGEFKNPLNFKEYFGIKFDLIGIHFVKATNDDFSAFQMVVYFIQDEIIADSETYFFKPIDSIFESKYFQRVLNKMNIHPDFIKKSSFYDIWRKLDIKDFFNSNTIVLWDKDAQTLEAILKSNGIKDYDMKYVKIKEIAQDKELPDSVEGLLRYIQSDLTTQTDLSLICASLAKDFRDDGLSLEKYEHTLKA